mmetsp:Transcript_27710/g.26747  ORF Transcript_27710/g.26747 Transcript_27710/m.26747 type:complete len:139 (-) Transcript_27710:2021-2437(-)
MLVSSLSHHQVESISFNENHSLALSKSRQLFSWGLALDGALGISKCSQESFNQPLQINVGTSKINSITTGKHASAIFKEGNEVMVCGRNDSYSLLSELNWQIIQEFQELKIPGEVIIDVTLGSYFTTFIQCESGNIYG